MIPRILCVCLLSFGFVNAAPKRKVYMDDEDVTSERIKALYVKDSENGDLRFLTGTGGTGDLNTAITNVQNILERFRPTSSNSLGTQLGTLTGTGLSSTSSTSGVTPIIVSLGGTSSTNTASSNAVLSGSPITGLLPQIVAQSVLGNRRVPVRRRVGARPINRRVTNQNNRNQVYLIRPGRS